MEKSNEKWTAIAFTWPVKAAGMEASKRIHAGEYRTRQEAFKAAEQKMQDIDGVGFTVERVAH